ncbi:hypothetical protein DFH11DRAFT_1732183 [Phellopilus nigrolimitatus]|nr:hypothetical protein DFH11DRAFT_1732183 [Phellopilus nigrolimitatus]
MSMILPGHPMSRSKANKPAKRPTLYSFNPKPEPQCANFREANTVAGALQPHISVIDEHNAHSYDMLCETVDSSAGGELDAYRLRLAAGGVMSLGAVFDGVLQRENEYKFVKGQDFIRAAPCPTHAAFRGCGSSADIDYPMGDVHSDSGPNAAAAHRPHKALNNRSGPSSAAARGCPAPPRLHQPQPPTAERLQRTHGHAVQQCGAAQQTEYAALQKRHAKQRGALRTAQRGELGGYPDEFRDLLAESHEREHGALLRQQGEEFAALCRQHGRQLFALRDECAARGVLQADVGAHKRGLQELRSKSEVELAHEILAKRAVKRRKYHLFG